MENDGAFEGKNEDQLRWEDELIRLHLHEALGEHSGGCSAEPLPAEIERHFLEQVIAFHQRLPEHRALPLRAHLGFPQFRPSAVLGAKALELNWNKLASLLKSKGLRVDFLADYPLSLKYDFITQELFDYQAELPGSGGPEVCFIYEDFHQNHEYDLRRRTEEFMEGFFGGRFPEKAGWYLADELQNDEGTVISRGLLHALLDRFHGLFESIEAYDFHIHRLSPGQEDEPGEEKLRTGCVEGEVRYLAILSDGQEQEISGPFKLYLQCRYDWWEIVYFQLYGFSWRR